MEEVKQAANAVEESTEGIATPQADVKSEPEVQGEKDITQTQAFAKRLSEATTKAEMKARDELISEIYGETHNIHTYAEFKEALKDQEIRKQFEQKELPEEVVNELVESRKFREQYEKQQEEIRTQKAKEKDQLDFLNYFKEVNGRYFDGDKDEIPQEVWDENNNGVPLKKAYANYMKEQRIQQLEKELEEVKKGTKAKQANEENASTATGSATANGSDTGDTFFTKEQVQKMSKEEVRKYYNQILKSTPKW